MYGFTMCLSVLYVIFILFFIPVCVVILVYLYLCLCMCVCVQGGVTIDLELLLPKEAKMLPETSPPLHYNVFLYKLPKSPKKSPVLRRPPGRSVQGRPLSQLCPRRSSEPSYSPISTRSLPGVLSGSSSPHLGTAYTP